MRKTHFLKTTVLLSAIALLSTGCSSSGNDTGGGETAVMYSSNNETTIGVVTDTAASLDPPLKIEVVTGSSGPLLQRIESEASNPAADVFYGAPAATLEEYAEFVEPYRSPEADHVHDELIDPDDRWIATNEHVVAFMANTDQIDNGTAPTTWKELTKPEWKGKIIVADPTQSTTALTALYGASKVLSENDFAKLVDNLETTENSGNVYPAVAQGEYALTIAYESNIYPYIEGGHTGVEMVYPEDGTFLEHDSVIIVKDGPNPEAAKKVIDTILSKEAQEENLAQSFRRPVRTDINPSDFVDFKDLEELNIIDIHGEGDGEGRTQFMELWKTLY